jgi:hypothetical protein
MSGTSSQLASLEPAFVAPLYLPAPEEKQVPLVHSSWSEAPSMVYGPTPLTGTVSLVQISSKTFFIQPDSNQRCFLRRVLARLENVLNDDVEIGTLSGRKVLSFRLGRGQFMDTFEAFEVLLASDLFFQPDCLELPPEAHADTKDVVTDASTTEENQAEVDEDQTDEHEEQGEEDQLAEEEEDEELTEEEDHEGIEQAQSYQWTQMQQPYQYYQCTQWHTSPCTNAEVHEMLPPVSTWPYPYFEPGVYNQSTDGNHTTVAPCIASQASKHQKRRAPRVHADTKDVVTDASTTEENQAEVDEDQTAENEDQGEEDQHAEEEEDEELTEEDISEYDHEGIEQVQSYHWSQMQPPYQYYQCAQWYTSPYTAAEVHEMVPPVSTWPYPHFEPGVYTQSTDGNHTTVAACITSQASKHQKSQTPRVHTSFECHLCRKGFSSQLQLDEHLEAHDRLQSPHNEESTPNFEVLARSQASKEDETAEVGPPPGLEHIWAQCFGEAPDRGVLGSPDAGSCDAADLFASSTTSLNSEACPVPAEHEDSVAVATVCPATVGTDLLQSQDPWASAFVGLGQALQFSPPGLEHLQQVPDARDDQVCSFSTQQSRGAAVEPAEGQHHSAQWNLKPVQWNFYQSDDWDPYHTSRVVDFADLSAHSKLLSDDAPENRRFCVLRAGNVDFIARFSDNALAEIKARSEHCLSGDKWTCGSLRTYLRYRWLRLLEQGRILHLVAYKDYVLKRKSQAYLDLAERGYSQHVLLFHTGLVDAKGEAIFVVLVQDLENEKYVLLRSGVHSMVNGKLPEWWCNLLRSAEMYVNGPAYKDRQEIDSLLNASYFQARDQRLLFDPSLEVKLNADRIVQKNLDRLIMAGVDVEEALYRDRPETVPSDESQWRFLCKKGKKIRELKYDYTHNSFVFSRRNLGKRSVEQLVRRWQEESVRETAYNFTLAVPHFYYTLVPVPNDIRQRQVYVGRLQLLLPLFCDGTTPKLALSIQYQEGASPYYFSATVLTISMANNNARQITTPQVPWIRAPEEDEDVDEF